MYDKSSTATDIDSVRLDLFARKQRAYDAIPTTSAALEHLEGVDLSRIFSLYVESN